MTKVCIFGAGAIGGYIAACLSKTNVKLSLIARGPHKEAIEKKGLTFIKDKKIGSFVLRQQILMDFPPKELRSIIDQGKKDIKQGIVVGISTFDEKVGVAVGVTKELTQKYDAVTLVKIASEVLEGQGGGGRKDFAQAGGINKNKIEDAFKAIINKIN